MCTTISIINNKGGVGGKLRSQVNEVRLRFLRILVPLVPVFDGDAMLSCQGNPVFFGCTLCLQL